MNDNFAKVYICILTDSGDFPFPDADAGTTGLALTSSHHPRTLGPLTIQ
jgi:hypothetical protein